MNIFSLLSSDDVQDDQFDENYQEDDQDDGSIFASPPCTPRRPIASPPEASRATDSQRGGLHTPPLSTSPLQQRLQRARSKRQQLHSLRISSLTDAMHQKSTAAALLHDESIKARANQSHVNNLNAQAAKERRIHSELQSRLNVEISSHYKSKCASKRKEEALSTIVDRASTSPSLQAAKLKRQQMDHIRAESILKQQLQKHRAHERLLHQLHQKQQSASAQERKERAALKRQWIQYEKRVCLLQSLQANSQALERNRDVVTCIVLQAREEILKCKERGRRVKSCRVIQRFLRKKFGWRSLENVVGLSEHDAVRRLQFWLEWRLAVCVGRFEKDNWDSLRGLMNIFVRDDEPSFDEIRVHMMKPETMTLVNVVLDCTKPITEASFGQQTASDGDVSATDGRTLLSLLLVAVCPADVLGEDYQSTDGESDRSKACARLLVRSAKLLLQSLRNLFIRLHDSFKSGTSAPSRKSVLKSSKSEATSPPKSAQATSSIFKSLRSAFVSSSTLFDLWKQMDLESLLQGMRVQLNQSWVIYLSSTKALKYLTEVTGVEGTASKQDDPLTALRLRHEASRAGSRSHIKRVRASLDKLVGSDEAKEVVTTAKSFALEEIARTNMIGEMREEVDAMLGRVEYGDAEEGTSPICTPREHNESMHSSDHNEEQNQLEPQLSAILPAELVSNVRLVHRILLTDSKDFDKISWDGCDAQSSDVSVEEFMQLFQPQSTRSESEIDSFVDVSVRIAQSMKLAFFNNIAIEFEQGNFDPIRALLLELHKKMRALLPNRQDLHSHVDDKQVADVSSITDVMRLLLCCGRLLSSYLESPARAPSTRELLQCLEYFNNQTNSLEHAVPYGIESAHLFAVACTGFILHKIELTQTDISNYKLASVAPILHHVGVEYERKQFQTTYGDFENASVEILQTNLPATWDWIKGAKSQSESEGTSTQSFDQKMDLVKSQFVDGVLFTKAQLTLPEVFTLDAESIGHIRNEARCCVISSALVLHACKVSKSPTSILSSDFTSEEVILAKDALSSVLRKRHCAQDALEASVIGATNDLAVALAGRALDAAELKCLSNHVLAVLQGDDPVLKLLDNRVRSFFCFACKWKANSSASISTQQPMEMKTGQSLLGEETGIKNSGIPSTKKEFSLVAQKEATRLGFAFFKSDLVVVGDISRRIIGLACSIYGREVLERFLSVQNGE